MRKIAIFILSQILVLLVFGGVDSFAAFVVTPMEFHLNVSAGEGTTNTFYIRNRGDETIALKVYAGDFWIEPDGKELFLESGTVERSCARWLEISPEELELAPGESQAIRFKIDVPLQMTGTYWAMIFVEQATKPTIKSARRGDQQFNIISFQRVGVRIFENTPGTEIEGGKITEVIARWDAEVKDYTVALKFQNDGYAHLKCNGFVDIKDMKGESVNKTDLDEFSCYPRSYRMIGVPIRKKLDKGQYTALAVVDYGADYLVAGEAVFEVRGDEYPAEKNITAVITDGGEKADGSADADRPAMEKKTSLDKDGMEAASDKRAALREMFNAIVSRIKNISMTLYEDIKLRWAGIMKLYKDKIKSR
ncbi:MAG: hypothetical protein ABH815_03800 [Candidatus Omnitrophota bacterium]